MARCSPSLGKYLLGGRVTLKELAFGQILTLNNHPPCMGSCHGQVLIEIATHSLVSILLQAIYALCYPKTV